MSHWAGFSVSLSVTGCADRSHQRSQRCSVFPTNTHSVHVHIRTCTLNQSPSSDCHLLLSHTGSHQENQCVVCNAALHGKAFGESRRSAKICMRQSDCNVSSLFVLFLLRLTLLCVFSHPRLGPLGVLYLFFLISEFLSGQPNMSEYSDLRHFSATLLGKAQRGWKNAALPYHCLQ